MTAPMLPDQTHEVEAKLLDMPFATEHPSDRSKEMVPMAMLPADFDNYKQASSSGRSWTGMGMAGCPQMTSKPCSSGATCRRATAVPSSKRLVAIDGGQAV